MSNLSKRSALLASVLSLSLASTAFAAPPKKPKPVDPAPVDAPVAPPPPAAKPEDPNAAEAQKHFKNGLELFKLHSHDASLAEFEKAYTLSNNYKILFNIALVYRDMNNFAGAVDMFDRYFAEGGSDIDAFRRAEVEAEYNRLAVYVAQLTVSANVDGAEILVDDYPAGKTPLDKPLRINAGTRRKVTVQLENGQPITKFIKAAGGEKVSVTFDLKENKAIASNQTTPVAPAKSLPPPEENKPSKFTTLSWVGLGSAAALGIGATITGIAALGSSSDLKKGTYVGSTPPDDLESSKSSARALSLTTDILIVAAVATAGVTLYLTLTHEPKNKTATTQVGFKVAGAGGALVGRF
jgi:hypothetical protein